MVKRRTAEEAFHVPAPVKEFIDRGVARSSVATDTAGNAALDSGTSQSPKEGKVLELGPERASRVGKDSGVPQAPPDELSRTYAKATVQKTIRFKPELIAELETYVRSQETRGEKPTPFQQIQNEALELWLKKNVRHSR